MVQGVHCRQEPKGSVKTRNEKVHVVGGGRGESKPVRIARRRLPEESERQKRK